MSQETKDLMQALETAPAPPAQGAAQNGTEQTHHSSHSHHSHPGGHSRHGHRRRRSLKHQLQRIFSGTSHYPDHHDTIESADARRAVLFVALAAVLLLGAMFFISRWENQKYAVTAQESAVTLRSQPKPQPLEVNGVVYTPKENLQTCLFMGIDVSGEAKPIDGYIGGGQADVQMLVVVDHAARTWQLLQLNRDTMTEIPVLGPDGSVQRTEFQQLALAHAYGNGHKQSCVNVVNTVSALLGGQSIDGYYSLNLDGIAILNDAVGGVPVTITSDFSQVDASLPQGETVTLTGPQAVTFVRTRKGVDDQTNVARMARQRAYLTSFFDCLKQQSDETILKAYDDVFPYTVTDMGSKTVTEMIGFLRDYEELPILTIDGEARVENEHWAYYLDDTSLQTIVLQLFYQEED